MPTLDNAKHERFAQELASGKTSGEAYVAAGYKENRGNASVLKANQNILERVREIQAGAAKQVELTCADILQMLIDDRNKARSLENPQMGAAIKAAELLGKELGMFIDRHADVSPALYAISDQPMPIAEWREKFTKPAPTEH